MANKPDKADVAQPGTVFHAHVFHVTTIDLPEPQVVSRVEVHKDEEGNLFIKLRK
jgi:hypothetical protein